jgi:hypothetical protein
MLTIAKLRTYAKFDGDLDGWNGTADNDGAAGLTDAAWYLIDELLMNLATVTSGQAAVAVSLALSRIVCCRRLRW